MYKFTKVKKSIYWLACLCFLAVVACNTESNKNGHKLSQEELLAYFGQEEDSLRNYEKGQILFEENNPAKNPFKQRIDNEAKARYDQGSLEEEYTDAQLLYLKANGDTVQLDDYMLKIQATYDCDVAVIIKFESNWNGTINYAEILDIAGPDKDCLGQVNLSNHIQRYRLKTKRFNLPSSQTWTIPIKLQKGKIKD